MKKNFFKKLSFVMALAMILSMITPAAGVFAKAAPKLNGSTKYLYLDQDGKNEFDFNISNKPTAKGYTYKWSSSKTTVATVDKAGLTTATGAGKTTVSVVIKNKAGEVYKKLSATVYVRDNIKTLTIANKPEGDKLTVGKSFDFNRTYVTYANKSKGSEGVTGWFVDKEGATISTKGVFVATKPGEYTITAKAFQSASKYKEYVADPAGKAGNVTNTNEATYKVKVVGAMVSAKQVDLSKFALTFASEMTKEEVLKNVSVSFMVGTTPVKQVVKAVDMDAKDAKIAYVTLYVPFTTGATVVADYPEMESVQFVAATTNVEDVTGVEIATTEANPGVGKDLEVKLFNKDGVNITTSALTSRVTYSSSDSVKGNILSNKLYMFEKGAQVTITAEYHTYKYDPATSNEIGKITASGVVTCVDPASTVIGSVAAWTIVNNNTPDYSNVNNKIAVEDAGYRLFVKLNTTTGSSTGTVSSDQAAEVGNFKFTSSDESKLIVTNNGNLLVGKEGAVVIAVSYKDKVVAAINVTVSPKRAAQTLALDSYDVSVSNTTNFVDTKTVNISLKDQLGADYALNVTNFEQKSGPAAIANSAYAFVSGSTIVFKGYNGTTKATKGDYFFLLTANGKTAPVTLHVVEPGSAVGAYDLSISSKTPDTKVEYSLTDSSKYLKNVTIDLFGYSNGVKLTQVSTVSGSAFQIKVINPDGAVTVLNGNTFALTTASGSAISKVKAGTYRVEAYNGTTLIDSDFFTVSDSQTAPVLAEVKAVTSESTDLLTAIKDCFKFTLNGADITSNVLVGDIIGNATDTKLIVKNVKYRLDLGNGYYYEMTIDVSRNITKK